MIKNQVAINKKLTEWHQKKMPIKAKILKELRQIMGDDRAEFHEIKKIISEHIHEDKSRTDRGVQKKCQECEDYMAQMEKNTNGIVMILTEDKLEKAEKLNKAEKLKQEKGYTKIKSKLLKNRKVSNTYDICPDTPYAQQQSAFSIGTGFFIAKGTTENRWWMATAAHVVVDKTTDISNLRFVHGIQLDGNNDFNTAIWVHNAQIFKPVDNHLSPKHYCLSYMSDDWAVIEVEKVYNDTEPLYNSNPIHIVKTRTGISIGEEVYSLGHGLGLPAKISYEGAIIRKDTFKPYFECSLTLLGGNSGSPVFSAETHECLGIYIRGIKKLIQKEGQTCLSVKNEKKPMEGQECQYLEPVVAAIDQSPEQAE